MFNGLPGRTARRLWRAVPYQVRLRLLPHILAGLSETDKLGEGFPTMEGLLRNAAANGFRPGSIVDIGANAGDWSRMARSVFTDAPLVMLEANPEMEAAMQQASRELAPRAHHAIVLLGAAPRDDVTFYAGGVGSGVLRELTTYEKRTLSVSMTTLDAALLALSPDVELPGPLLMKLDVQGYELEVLRGGSRALAQAELVILEIATVPYNEGAPLFAEVVRFMDERGFSVYDFCGQFRRQTDNTLFQTDVAFVATGSSLRSAKRFWLNER